MTKLGAKLLLLWGLLAAALPAHAGQLMWGFESWGCGLSQYNITVGNGANISVTGLSGFISAAPNPLSNPTNGYMRQSLMAVSYPGAPVTVRGVVTGNPSQPRYENGIDGNLLEVNLKQTATNDVHMPINVTYPTPVLVTGGNIFAVINTVTYNGTQIITEVPGECLDTEVHLLIFYQ
jgi:hypothetical protein